MFDKCVADSIDPDANICSSRFAPRSRPTKTGQFQRQDANLAESRRMAEMGREADDLLFRTCRLILLHSI